ncbi:mobile mystery protein A [Dyadobacter jiangsuensis]
MTYWDKKLVRQQLDEKIAKISVPTFQKGWIKVVREALGMSARQLGKRAKIDQSRVSRLENAELDGDLKLSSLKKIAEAMDMHFVYAFVPQSSLESAVNKQAVKIASNRMARVNHTMRLELQELSDEEKAKALSDLVQKILIEDPKDFWDL